MMVELGRLAIVPVRLLPFDTARPQGPLSGTTVTPISATTGTSSAEDVPVIGKRLYFTEVRFGLLRPKWRYRPRSSLRESA